MYFPASTHRAIVAGNLLLAVCALPSQAATFTVSNLDDTGAGSLRAALTAANAKTDADTIIFAATLKGQLNLTTGELPITSPVTISGPGATVLALSGNESSRIFNVSGNQVAIRGLTLTRGKQSGTNGAPGDIGETGKSGGEVKGGAIYNTGSLTLTDVALTNNSAIGGHGGDGGPGRGSGRGGMQRPGGNGGSAQGGAIYNVGTLALSNTSLQNNSAIGGRGGKGSQGGNGGMAQGGAIFNAGLLSQAKASFANNLASGGEGGKSLATYPVGTPGASEGNDIYTHDVAPIVQDVVLDGTQWRAFQGQLGAQGHVQSYSLVAGRLPNGLMLDAKTGRISGTPTASVLGLKVTYRASNPRHISNTATITFNIKASDPASYVVNTTSDAVAPTDGKTSLREAIEDANFNADKGDHVITFALPTNVPQNIGLVQGSLKLDANITIAWPGRTPLTITGPDGVFAIEGHKATLSGFKITGSQEAYAVICSAPLNISNSIISDNACGGIINWHTLNIANCTISGNTIPSNGGAIYNYATASVTNSTICNNSSLYGAIFNVSKLSLDSCTLTGNRSTGQYNTPGSVFDSSEPTRITNSIVVGNLPVNFSGTATNSIVSGSIEAAGLDPRGLQDNGGPTPTIALLPTSPAINYGNTTLTKDQRGLPRPSGGRADIGAFEYQGAFALPIELQVNSPLVREGNGNPATPSQLVFTLTLSKASTTPVMVNVQSANAATASATARADYVPLGRTRVTFAPGQTRQTVAITIVGDTVYEENERVGLLLSSPIGTTLKSTTAEGTILNDDALPGVSINDVSVVEGNNPRGYVKALFTVSLTNPSDRTSSVGYSTFSGGRGAAIGGTATTADADYLTVPSTTLTFAPGQTSKTILVYVKGDTIVEGNEIFGVRLAAPVNARIADGIGIGTIQNDDGSTTTTALTADAPSAGAS